jgi:hypothetical protein
MDVAEPRVRRRGFFLHSDTGEPDSGEHENPEGLAVRVRTARGAVSRQSASVAMPSGRSHAPVRAEDSRPQIRSGSVTGSRQRSHLPR